MKIISVDKLTELKYLNLFLAKYKDRIGKIKSWTFVSRSDIPDIMKRAALVSDSASSTVLSDKICYEEANTNLSTSKDNPNAVVLVPFHQEHQKLVIIKEFRVPLGEYMYGFPAGLMDKDETIEQTAARELKEETGLTITKVIRQSPIIYSSSGLTDESIALVYVICTGEPSVKWNEDSEDITVLMVSSEEAKTLLETPKLKYDVKSWIVLSTFARTGMI